MEGSVKFSLCEVARFKIDWFFCLFVCFILKQINLRIFFLKLNLLKELVLHKQEALHMRIAKPNRTPLPKTQFLNPPPREM